MYIFRNYTIEHLFSADNEFSGYGDISVISAETDAYLWFYQVPIVFDKDQQLAETESFKDKLQLVVSQVSTLKPFYVLSLENLFRVTYCDSDTALMAAVDDFNCFVKELSKTHRNVKFIDFSEFLAQFKPADWINWRFYFISQMIISPQLAPSFKQWFEFRIKTITTTRKKCLVLDLDNTLWSGVLGEDGISGIKVGGDYPGNSFLYFQEALIALADHGVILTVCSKNNEADVLDAWEKNPFIKLNKTYISAYRINWHNKVDNIRELALELNIGMDSMVFVDDNPAERELVRQQLPMVEVPEFPTKPYMLMPFFNRLVGDYFRVAELTEEDKHKTAQYKANAQRNALQHQFIDLSDYIRSLDIEIDVIEANEFNIPRIAQMTQKTNQFNLTTHRYTEADINRLLAEGASIYCISVSDRFGNNGITGVIIVERNNTVANIDSLLLSCRILGKNIETAFVKSVLNILLAEGVKVVRAKYIPTAKNHQVAEFYDKIGLELIAENNGTKEYRLTLCEPLTIEDYYKINII
jgi:FkbH-like protein